MPPTTAEFAHREGNPEIKKAYQACFNDGLQCGVDNAREFEYINEEQAEELLTELVKEEN